MANLVKGARELIIKFLSSRLNIRPYDKLSKEVEDFKDLWDEYIYTQHQIPNEYHKIITCLRMYTQNKRKVGDRMEPWSRYKLTPSWHNKNMTA